jgi:hypothetical protein
MTMESATVNLPYPEFVKMQQRADAGDRLATELRAEIASLRAQQITGDPKLVRTLLDGLLAARTSVLFATGQLPPESTRGWPADAVRKLGLALREIKHLVPEETDLLYHADDLLHFVKTIEDAESVRRLRTEAA